MTSAARAISPHRFELVRDDGERLGRVWLYIDQPAFERQFYVWWWPDNDELRVVSWWTNDCAERPASELEPGAVVALRDYCRASDDVIELVNRYARES